MDTTKSTLDAKKEMRTITMSLCLAFEQEIQIELPRDELNPG